MDALRVRAPAVRPDRQGPTGGGLYGPPFRPSARPRDQHDTLSIRLEPRPLHREIREPLPVGRVARGIVGAPRGRELAEPPAPPRPYAVPADQIDGDVGFLGNRATAGAGHRLRLCRLCLRPVAGP